MQKRFLALTFLALFALAATLSATVPIPGGTAGPATTTATATAPVLPFLTPKPTPRITCDLLYQYCLRNNCTPGDSDCETACLCQYYSCQGLDLPNECIY